MNKKFLLLLLLASCAPQTPPPPSYTFAVLIKRNNQECLYQGHLLTKTGDHIYNQVSLKSLDFEISDNLVCGIAELEIKSFEKAVQSISPPPLAPPTDKDAPFMYLTVDVEEGKNDEETEETNTTEIEVEGETAVTLPVYSIPVPLPEKQVPATARIPSGASLESVEVEIGLEGQPPIFKGAARFR